MIKVLFCGLKYEYGKPEAGLSFEYQNFYEVLKRMEGVEAELFAFDEKMLEVGRDALNAELIYEVEEKKPDLLFCFLFTEELKKATIEYVTRKTKTKTFNWFADDHWRFHIFSKYWAPLFTAVSTTDSQAVDKYKAIGLNPIKTQWAANIESYKPMPGGQVFGITFVGKNYGNRENYISFLKTQGLPAEGFGSGWPNGRVNQDKMLQIFSNSKINLNFTESYFYWPKQLVKLFLKKEMQHYRLNLSNPVSNIKSFFNAMRPQIKGRSFEVPACGGFLITGDADNLRDYYEDGREIIIFKNKEDLAKKCKYYLEHPQERQKIAEAGYYRTIKEHTYEKRFYEIFKVLGLK